MMSKEEAWAKYQLFNIAEARTVAIDPYEDAFDAGWEEGRKALVEEAVSSEETILVTDPDGVQAWAILLFHLKQLVEGDGDE
jgi:hypothetical protein